MKRCGALCLLIVSGTVMAGKDKGTQPKREEPGVDCEALWKARGDYVHTYVRSEEQKERLRERERQEQEIKALRFALSMGVHSQ